MTSINLQYGLPLILEDLNGTIARSLPRVRLEEGGAYKERWLQVLVSKFPNVLPIEQLEPALTPLISICMEMKVSSGGFVDILLATPSGDLIIVEMKLFRNPAARREVVGQIMDYAKDISTMSYEDLEKAIKNAEAPNGEGGHPKSGLYESVAAVGNDEVNQEQFIDAVTRNLKRGRFLLLVVGDGIREGTETITSFLQQHAGMHFTFGLVELAIYKLADLPSKYLVQPRILARTVNIDRGIVSIESGEIRIRSSSDLMNEPSASKRTILSEEKFYEELNANMPLAVSELKQFVASLVDRNISAEFGTQSMILKWQLDEGRRWNIGSIMTTGKVWTEYLNAQADAEGLMELSHAYLQQIAAGVPGAEVRKRGKATSWYVALGRSYVTIDRLLAYKETWIAAIDSFIDSVEAKLRED